MYIYVFVGSEHGLGDIEVLCRSNNIIFTSIKYVYILYMIYVYILYNVDNIYMHMQPYMHTHTHCMYCLYM
jgi:hypothetical protein